MPAPTQLRFVVASIAVHFEVECLIRIHVLIFLELLSPSVRCQHLHTFILTSVIISCTKASIVVTVFNGCLLSCPFFFQCVFSIPLSCNFGPRGCKAFFMLNSAEHENCPANKSQIINNCKLFLAKQS